MLNWIQYDLAIDLGTANILFYIPGRGIVINEPAIVALSENNQCIAVGNEAKVMHQRAPKHIKTVKPLQDGVVAEYTSADQLIKGLLKKLNMPWYRSLRRILICVPSGVNEAESKIIRDCAQFCGARHVSLIEEPLAAAIGAKIDIHEAKGHLVVDIGGGTTDIASISTGGIVNSISLKKGGDTFNKNIINYLLTQCNLRIGELTAEDIKCKISSATPLSKEESLKVTGQDSQNKTIQEKTITSKQIREAIKDTLNSIIAGIMQVVDEIPPELAADLQKTGIALTGGGALIKNLDTLICQSINLPTYVVKEPLLAVVKGTGHILENISDYEDILS